ncbi:dienelactone hydrolase family protein [Nocardia macrotermitis]|uniref:Dienelactone hydrolase domain-containing protein n=1 Tax=Nocardia macrotermitis TaxID=2585198 RepID=A0A7K0D7M3_9NOCA|nr:dienelactone hydrolase family protein [Nocardia macrotermitis]MQY21717.1 hypothetical protein [Nocardia macrotermitis]
MAIICNAHTYRDGKTDLTGVLYRDFASGPSPAILLIHGGAGLDEHARDQAQRWARLGYTVFACDMYGDGIVGDRERVMKTVTTLSDDAAMLVRRAETAMSLLTDITGHDRIAVVGYCFGGMAALQLARSGSSVRAAVSIHGSLRTQNPAAPGAVRARILVCHGATDPHVPLADLTAFADEMDRARADWQFNIYGDAAHGFTHKHATPGGIPGVAYNESADRRSFEDAQRILDTVFRPDAGSETSFPAPRRTE